MNKPIRVVVLHGSYGSPDSNWFPWLKLQVESAGHAAVVPKLPTPDGQNLSAWKEAFRSQVGQIDRSTILIGHSLGAGFILNLLEDEDVGPVVATFLVAGFIGELGLPEFDGINATFVCKDFNWQRIKQQAGAIFVINGDDDPYVPLAKGTALADALTVPLLLVPGGGHLNAETGYTSFSLLETKLAAILVFEYRFATA